MNNIIIPWNRILNSILPMYCHVCNTNVYTSKCIPVFYMYILCTTEQCLPFEQAVADAKPTRTKRRINDDLISITVDIVNGQRNL